MSNNVNQAIRAYASTAQGTISPRQLEAQALLRAAAKLEAVSPHVEDRGHYPALDEALTHNRNLWTVFAAEMVDDANPLARELRAQIANLAVFIFKTTFETLARPAADKLALLIEINRNIASGLLLDPSEQAP